MNDGFQQLEWPVRLAWGRRGVNEAAARGDVVVVVDVLSFATSVAVACSRGARIIPVPKGADPSPWLHRPGTVLAVRREEATPDFPYSLSPASFEGVPSGLHVVLPSPNGAACVAAGRGAACVLVGGLVNATAVGRRVGQWVADGASVTVVACGERWPRDGKLRFALEDYLGAGAILSQVAGWASPEARVCELAFKGATNGLNDLLSGCGSGQELLQRGYAGDVELAARLDHLEVVPVLDGDGLAADRP